MGTIYSDQNVKLFINSNKEHFRQILNDNNIFYNDTQLEEELRKFYYSKDIRDHYNKFFRKEEIIVTLII